MFLALGAPEEAYAPGDLDRAYVAGDARCFPLIVAYGDVEFHFAAPTELTTLFVDSFSGRRGAPDGGPLKLADPGPLREGTSWRSSRRQRRRWASASARSGRIHRLMPSWR